MAGALPLKGTWTISTPASCLNNSRARCGALPLPAEPKLSFPGFFLAYATSSWTLRAGTDSFTSR